MSVRHGILAILDQGPCYGYQLRAEFDRRTGSVWPLNVGQIYNTLERLERDGLVRRGDADAQGHVYWAITAEGSATAARWLTSPVSRDGGLRDEAAIKLALATTLPGVDAAATLTAQRAEALRRRAALVEAEAVPHGDGAERSAAMIVIGAQRAAVEAELRWLDEAEAGILAAPPDALALATERPRRGRPARAAMA